MKVALCFWGLTRSLKYTIHSINKYILQIFKEKKIEYKIFLHTFRFDSNYHNPRAYETNIELNFNEYTLLNPDYVEIEDQDEVKTNIGMHKYRKLPDPWESDYVSVDNFICAMYSKKQVGIMVENCDMKFDYIVYLRPDVKYSTYFDVKYFSLTNQYSVCTPNFHLFPKMNDRFCLLTANNLKQYYSLFDEMYKYSLSNPLHSERFQYHIINNVYKWKIYYIPFYFNRVRANGAELNDCEKINQISKQNKKSTRKKLNTPLIPENKIIQPIFKTNHRQL